MQIVKEVDPATLQDWKNRKRERLSLPQYEFQFSGDEEQRIVEKNLSYACRYFSSSKSSLILRNIYLLEEHDDDFRDYLDTIVANLSNHLALLYNKDEPGVDLEPVGNQSPEHDYLLLILALSKLANLEIDYYKMPAADSVLRVDSAQLINPLKLIRWYRENRDSIDLSELKQFLIDFDVYLINSGLDIYINPIPEYTPLQLEYFAKRFPNPVEATERQIPYYRRDYKINPQDSACFKKFNDIIGGYHVY